MRAKRSERQYAEGPELTASNCIPVLISSDFLQMERLVEECLAHICRHILEVVRQPLDMSCLAEHLLRRLAAQLTEDTLELLRRLPASKHGDVDGGGGGVNGVVDTVHSQTPPAVSVGGSALLVSKLYRLKLEQLLEARSATTCVARCTACGR